MILSEFVLTKADFIGINSINFAEITVTKEVGFLFWKKKISERRKIYRIGYMGLWKFIDDGSECGYQASILSCDFAIKELFHKLALYGLDHDR